MTQEKKYYVYVDETGTVHVDSDGREYGFGFCVVEQCEELASFEKDIVTAFPEGMHLKEVRKPRKVKYVEKAISVAQKYGFVRGGAMMFSNPDYSKDLFYNLLANRDGICDRVPNYREVFEEAISKIHPEQGIALPREMTSKGMGVSRLEVVWDNACTLLLISLLNIGDGERELKVNIRLGKVTPSKSYMEAQKRFAENYPARFRDSFENYRRKGLIPRRGVRAAANIELVDGKKCSPVFGFADFFAGIGHHFYRWYRDKEDTIGLEMHKLVEPIFSRLPKAGKVHEIGRGIYLFNK